MCATARCCTCLAVLMDWGAGIRLLAERGALMNAYNPDSREPLLLTAVRYGAVNAGGCIKLFHCH